MRDSETGFPVDDSFTVLVIGKDGVIRPLVHHRNSPTVVLKALQTVFSE